LSVSLGSHYEIQAYHLMQFGLELPILLPQPPNCWCAYLHLALFLVFECFYHDHVLNLVKTMYWILSNIFCMNWNAFMAFIIHSRNVMYYMNQFLYLEISLHSKNKPQMVMVYNPFHVQFVNIFVKILYQFS
jgi:hypothetical protein